MSTTKKYEYQSEQLKVGWTPAGTMENLGEVSNKMGAEGWRLLETINMGSNNYILRFEREIS